MGSWASYYSTGTAAASYGHLILSLANSISDLTVGASSFLIPMLSRSGLRTELCIERKR
jgi:hypothetical protein